MRLVAVQASLFAVRDPLAQSWRDIGRRAVRPFIVYRPRRGGLSTWSTSLDQTGDSLNRERIRADQATMAAIADGDEAAFARLVRDLAPVVLRFARATLAGTGPAEAEEVVQEALLRLWRQAPTWQPDGRVSTWLHQVAYRLCLDRIRRRRPAVDIDLVEDDLADPAPSPSARLVHLEDVRAVQAAVAALPERQRTAIVLCHYQGLSQAEAAEIMHIGEEAYESLLARGRRRLRAVLGGGKEGKE
jgi:RNA polymerase sigma-70 factor, ECF subfamily